MKRILKMLLLACVLVGCSSLQSNRTPYQEIIEAPGQSQISLVRRTVAWMESALLLAPGAGIEVNQANGEITMRGVMRDNPPSTGSPVSRYTLTARVAEGRLTLDFTEIGYYRGIAYFSEGQLNHFRLEAGALVEQFRRSLL